MNPILDLQSPKPYQDKSVLFEATEFILFVIAALEN
jgi:hypothetical protein